MHRSLFPEPSKTMKSEAAYWDRTLHWTRPQLVDGSPFSSGIKEYILSKVSAHHLSCQNPLDHVDTTSPFLCLSGHSNAVSGIRALPLSNMMAPRFQMATANNSARFIHRSLLQCSSFQEHKNTSKTKKNNSTKTATLPTAIRTSTCSFYNSATCTNTCSFHHFPFVTVDHQISVAVRPSHLRWTHRRCSVAV